MAGASCSQLVPQELLASYGLQRRQDGLPLSFRVLQHTGSPRIVATNSMAGATYFKRYQGSFSLLTACKSAGRLSLIIRTLQHTGHPHPVLSSSTSGVLTLRRK